MTAQSARGREPLAIPAGATPLPLAWKRADAIALWPDGPPGGPITPPRRQPGLAATFLTGITRPELKVFRPRKANGRALLVIPGGAYAFVSIRNEGTDVAAVYTRLGYTVFVLAYRLPGEGWANRADVPLQDAQRAIRLIRSRAAHFGIDAAAVAVLGFSAGGHLAASLLTASGEVVHTPVDAVDAIDARPACGGLIYPVIALAPPLTHAFSASNLLGPDPALSLVERRSPALHVTAATPPTFLAHSLDDPAVPSGNATLFHEALQRAHRPAELHLFEEGGHGYGTGPTNAPAGLWPSLFARFLDRHIRD